MKVSELAEKVGVSVEEILDKLRALRLKAKDGDQELNSAVASVIKSEFVVEKKQATKKEKVEKVAKTPKKKVVKKTEKEIKKKVVKKEEQEVNREEQEVKKEVQEGKEVKEVEKKKESKVKEDVKEEIIKKKTEIKVQARDKEVQKVKVKKVSVKIKKDKSFEADEDEVSTGITKSLTKQRSKISKEPLITLKPLLKKKKRSAIRKDGDRSEEEHYQDIGLVADQEADHNQNTSSELLETPVRNIEDMPEIEVRVPITVKDISVKVQQKPSMVLKYLMKLGVFAHINLSLEGEIVEKIALEFGYRLAAIKTQEEQLIEIHQEEEEDPKLLTRRAPVITFMGHVDHGKTTLVDKIRKSKLVDQEHGGITQHMDAYSVEMPKGRITLLDTPGHEAFTAMRARGAHITDIIILVVAADEGIMLQTKEAIDHARAAGVPIVVALTKMDKKNADPDRVKKQLSELDLLAEDWGGKTIVAGVSGLTGDGVDNLLEMVLLEAEMLELKANAKKKASGIVVEAHMSQGKGAVTSLIVQSGTLNDGDFLVVGPFYGKVKAMFNDRHKPIKEAGPSMPVEILGLSDVPEAGERFYVVEDEKQAKDISSRKQELVKQKRLNAKQRITLEDLYSQIQEGAVKELSVILKSDVQGSLEALRDSLAKIPSEKVKVKFIHTGVGEVNTSDVVLAVASDAIIIAFHVGIDVRAKQELEKEHVDVRQYRIIYDAVNEVRSALEGLLEAKKIKKFLCRIEIREVFKLSKQGIVAGCYVIKGKVLRKANVDVIRDSEIVFSGKIGSLKRFKDDVREVTEGMECGITVDGFNQIKAGDIIEAYDIETIAQKL